MYCFTFEHFYYKAHSDFPTFQAVMGFHSFHYDMKINLPTTVDIMHVLCIMMLPLMLHQRSLCVS